ncbi:MAG TPA: hypothetical protein VM687_17915 [Stenotrophomonas sp.]|nr:hypothetical protein [Stenotrophomonas sp.]
MATPADGGAPRRGIQGRMAGVWAGLLLLVVLVVAAWHSGGSRLHESDASAPWIGLPPGGTDLATWQARGLIQQTIMAAPPENELLQACGIDPNLGHETYVATVTDDRGEQGWRITLTVQNEDVLATASPAAFRPPPPPGSHGYSAITSLIHRQVLRQRLADVRDLWRSTSLWSEDPGQPTGLDGISVRLEACIDGSYGLRVHPASDTSARLHTALARALSLPASTPTH